jgi:hypothetical protein
MKFRFFMMAIKKSTKDSTARRDYNIEKKNRVCSGKGSSTLT